MDGLIHTWIDTYIVRYLDGRTDRTTSKKKKEEYHQTFMGQMPMGEPDYGLDQYAQITLLRGNASVPHPLL